MTLKGGLGSSRGYQPQRAERLEHAHLPNKPRWVGRLEYAPRQSRRDLILIDEVMKEVEIGLEKVDAYRLEEGNR